MMPAPLSHETQPEFSPALRTAGRVLAAIGGAAAALAGGVVTAATGQARWIAGGMAITIVFVVVLSLLVGIQETALK